MQYVLDGFHKALPGGFDGIGDPHRQIFQGLPNGFAMGSNPCLHVIEALNHSVEAFFKLAFFDARFKLLSGIAHRIVEFAHEPYQAIEEFFRTSLRRSRS